MKQLKYLFLFLLLIFSCNQVSYDSNRNIDLAIVSKTISYLNGFQLAGSIREDVDGGVQSWERFGTTWKQDTISYYIDYIPLIIDEDTIYNYFNNEDKLYIQKLTIAAAKEWSPHINKYVYETCDSLSADFYILWKPLENDGKGKRLAVSDGPLDDDMISKPIMIMDLVDMYEIVKNREKSKYKYYNVILHEFGHMLAGLAHDGSIGVMNSAFNFNTLQLDDICGARVVYNNYKDFSYGGTTYTFLHKSDLEKNITKNFKVKEFISKCGVHEKGHFISKDIIESIQYIRDYYNQPIQITSSYRDTRCNIAAGGATRSQHLFRNALDWKFVGTGASKTQNKYFNDIIGKKAILGDLLKKNMRGFGSYSFNSMLNHIDTRQEPIWNASYKGTGYMVWGKYSGAFELGNEFNNYD